MWQNIRCSILFHLLVPGGKWHTEMPSPLSLANRCNSTFHRRQRLPFEPPPSAVIRDRKSTRLNSSHSQISYAVFCLKKKKRTNRNVQSTLQNAASTHIRPDAIRT